MVELQLKAGADAKILWLSHIGKLWAEPMPALYFAAAQGHVGLIALFLWHGVSSTTVSKTGITPRSWGSLFDHKDASKFLREHGPLSHHPCPNWGHGSSVQRVQVFHEKGVNKSRIFGREEAWITNSNRILNTRIVRNFVSSWVRRIPRSTSRTCEK